MARGLQQHLPERAEGYWYEGDILLRQKDYPGAENAYAAALERVGDEAREAGDEARADALLEWVRTQAEANFLMVADRRRGGKK